MILDEQLFVLSLVAQYNQRARESNGIRIYDICKIRR